MTQKKRWFRTWLKSCHYVKGNRPIKVHRAQTLRTKRDYYYVGKVHKHVQVLYPVQLWHQNLECHMDTEFQTWNPTLTTYMYTAVLSLHTCTCILQYSHYIQCTCTCILQYSHYIHVYCSTFTTYTAVLSLHTLKYSQYVYCRTGSLTRLEMNETWQAQWLQHTNHMPSQLASKFFQRNYPSYLAPPPVNLHFSIGTEAHKLPDRQYLLYIQ